MIRTLFILCFVLTLSSPCSAQSQPTSVRELIIIGLEKNIGLQVQALNIPLTKAEIEVNSAAFDPELFAASNYVDTVSPIASSLSLLDQSEAEQFSGEVGAR